jgi:hypothetical protein
MDRIEIPQQQSPGRRKMLNPATALAAVPLPRSEHRMRWCLVP